MTIKELVEKYVEHYPDIEVADNKGKLCGLRIRKSDFSPKGKDQDAVIKRRTFLEKFGSLEVEEWNLTARPLPDTLTVKTVITICVKDLEVKDENGLIF